MASSAKIELRFPHQRLERGVGDLHVGEIELDQVGFDRAVLERLGVGIVPDQGEQLDLVGFGQHGGFFELVNRTSCRTDERQRYTEQHVGF